MSEETTVKTKKRTPAVIAGILILAAVLILVAVSAKKSTSTESSVTSYQAMGTVISGTVYAENKDAGDRINKLCKDEIDRLEKEDISWRIENSDVWKINHNGTATVDPATAKVIRQCLDVAKNSDGNYDVTVGKLSTLWNIGTDEARLPSDPEIQNAKRYVDWTKVKVDGNTVTIGDGQFLDLGGIGKGYAADKCGEILKENHATGAAIAVGGSVILYGENPNKDDGKWTIGIQDPGQTHNDTCMTFKSGPCFVSTSGDYEKVLEVNGQKYHHILDPHTGYPGKSNVTSVTVVADNGALTDALATACFLYGYGQQSLDLLKKYNAEAVFITPDKKIYATSGIKDSLTITNDAYAFA